MLTKESFRPLRVIKDFFQLYLNFPVMLQSAGKKLALDLWIISYLPEIQSRLWKTYYVDVSSVLMIAPKQHEQLCSNFVVTY